MIIIGLAFIAVAAIFGIDLAANNRFHIHDISVFGSSIGVSGSATLYVIGAITGAVLVLGIVVLLAGLRHKGSKANQRRTERKARIGELEALRAENAELRQRLDALDGGGRTTTAPAEGYAPATSGAPNATGASYPAE